VTSFRGGFKYEASKHALYCFVCLKDLDEGDVVVEEVAGFVRLYDQETGFPVDPEKDEAEVSPEPVWWTTGRLAHLECAEVELDARDIRFGLAEPENG
jgi:hypothetical protein